MLTDHFSDAQIGQFPATGYNLASVKNGLWQVIHMQQLHVLSSVCVDQTDAEYTANAFVTDFVTTRLALAPEIEH